MSSKFSFSSTFNWEDGNLRALLKPILFSTHHRNDQQGTPPCTQNLSVTSHIRTWALKWRPSASRSSLSTSMT